MSEWAPQVQVLHQPLHSKFHRRRRQDQEEIQKNKFTSLPYLSRTPWWMAEVFLALVIVLGLFQQMHVSVLRFSLLPLVGVALSLW